MADVFVSYKAEDRRRISALVDALERDGFSVWWDAHVGAGQDWRDRIACELDAAKCVIVAWSQGSVGPAGRFVRDEAGRALHRGVYLPIKLDPVDPPLGFGETQVVSLIGWRGSRSAAPYRALVSAVGAVVRGEALQVADMDLNARPSRRAILVAGAAASAALAVGAGWWWRQHEALSPEVQRLMQDASEGVQDGGVEANANAIGKLRRATDLEPSSGAVWGLLALAYVQQSRVAPAKDSASLLARGLAAAKRAQSFEQNQPEAMAAHILAMPMFRNWYAVEQACRAALKRHPAHPQLLVRLATVLFQVGRHEECLSALNQALRSFSTPILHVGRITLLWNLGRLDEAEAELKRTFEMWPRHFAVWFTQVYYLAYNGRASEALAFLDDTSSRPVGIPDWNFDLVRSQADSIARRDATDINSTLRALEDAAHRAAGFAENAALFAAFTGRIDDAFTVLIGLYTNRGFKVGEAWFSSEQGIYTGGERNTYILFQQQMRLLRRDKRFADLAREVGLEEYWRRTQSRGNVLT
jgi:tetratricopeptide (TPR) repeat protein